VRFSCYMTFFLFADDKMVSGQVSNRSFVRMLVGGVRGLKKNYPHVPEHILNESLRTFPASSKIQVSTKRLMETVNRLYSKYLLNTVKTVARKRKTFLSFLASHPKAKKRVSNNVMYN
jgi:predicted alpha/beta-fold hydrolase